MSVAKTWSPPVSPLYTVKNAESVVCYLNFEKHLKRICYPKIQREIHLINQSAKQADIKKFALAIHLTRLADTEANRKSDMCMYRETGILSPGLRKPEFRR